MKFTQLHGPLQPPPRPVDQVDPMDLTTLQRAATSSESPGPRCSTRDHQRRPAGPVFWSMRERNKELLGRYKTNL